MGDDPGGRDTMGGEAPDKTQFPTKLSVATGLV